MGGCEKSVVAVDEAERSCVLGRHVVTVLGVVAADFLWWGDQDGVVVAGSAVGAVRWKVVTHVTLPSRGCEAESNFSEEGGSERKASPGQVRNGVGAWSGVVGESPGFFVGIFVGEPISVVRGARRLVGVGRKDVVEPSFEVFHVDGLAREGGGPVLSEGVGDPGWVSVDLVGGGVLYGLEGDGGARLELLEAAE
jgi:hypothetical protein